MNTQLRVLAATVMVMSGAVAIGAKSPDNAMAIVQVKVDGNGTSLLSVKVADGRIKRPRVVVAHPGELRFDVVDAAGNITFAGTLADPTRVELEYFHEDGTIGRIVEVKESGIAHLRIPFDPATREIRIARMVATEEGSAEAPRALLLGRVQVQLDAEVADE